jgi:SAM-dependent methyltransferase
MAGVPSMRGAQDIKSKQQQTWAAGDYSRVALGETIVGELLCEAVHLHALEKVLDVATGTGNTALAAARRRCEVVGIDFVPQHLEHARRRAEAEGIQVEFRDGDTEKIPFPDQTFDCVLSTFGAMFAPNQSRAARELVRVCRKGGRIGLANWPPDSHAGALFAATTRHVPAPRGLLPPTRWGTEAGLQELFGADGRGMRVEPRSVVFRGDSPEAYVAFLRKNFGPTLKAFEALDPAGQEALQNDLLEVVNRFNKSGDTTVYIPAEYLEVIVPRA